MTVVATVATDEETRTPRGRTRIEATGAVQGLGFRPFVYRLAHELDLAGFVQNTSAGVVIEVEGDADRLRAFEGRLETEKPSHCSFTSLRRMVVKPRDSSRFEILESRDGAKTAVILPDLATCPQCLAEVLDPANRRYLYPFTNCTHCGPRFSIVEAVPYDRRNTTMKRFVMCDICEEEYQNPGDRRFHAQPNACPDCGPRLEMWDSSTKVCSAHHEALLAAADAIREGAIVAVKGLGGFHLVVDARQEEAVSRLRERKRREEKPLAVMAPSLEAVRAFARAREAEERLLQSAAAPIVLLDKRSDHALAPSVAPGNPCVGVLLPYTPLHHLLMAELGFPVVATSGNLSDEPICIDEHEAVIRLHDIADVFLVHNRPIARHVDDSVARVIAGEEMVLRRARGYVPLPIPLPRDPGPALAVGGHLKNTIAVAVDGHALTGQHIGDLETTQATRAFHQVIDDYRQVYELKTPRLVCDAHPDYVSTRYAEKMAEEPCEDGAENGPPLRVQHHAAHVYACLADHNTSGPVLGISWDGTGYGSDGTIWGGEFLRVDGGDWERVAHLRTFRLPGGDRAVQEPRRSALGVLYAMLGRDAIRMRNLPPQQAFSEAELRTVETMLRDGLNAPLTSSMGRLFDAAASLLGIRQVNAFEGQAAMELEFAMGGCDTDEAYPFLERDGAALDWEPMLRALLEDITFGEARPVLAARFHNTLVESLVAVAKRTGEGRVALTGGCFQNRTLLERAIRRLREEEFEPLWHHRVPANDGGIAVGQLAALGWRKEREA